MYLSSSGSNRLSFIVSTSVFLFFAMMLAVPRGYAVGTVLLVLSSLYFLAKRPPMAWNGEDKLLTILLALTFLTGIFGALYHGDSLSALDLPTRYLLAIPVMIMIVQVPPRLSWMWAGLIIGAVAGAGLAYCETQVLGEDRPYGFTGAIQFGNLGLMMGVFCAAGLFWTAEQRAGYARLWQIGLVVGACAGVYVSISSEARGGWVAVPLVAVLCSVALIRTLSLKRVIAAAILICIGLTVAVVSVPSIERRYQDAINEIEAFGRGDADSSIGARFAIWHASALMIKQKPILGWGEQEYHVELERLVATKQVDEVVLRLANTHNNYLQIWIQQGVLGFLAILSILFVPFCLFCRRLRSSSPSVKAVAVCGAATCGAYAIFALSQVILGRNNTLLFFVISLAVLWGYMRSLERLSRPEASAHGLDC